MVELQFTVYQIPYIISALLTAWLTFHGLRKARSDERNKTILGFAAVVGFVTIWTVARIGELLFVDQTITRVWITVLYVGLGGSAPGILVFSLAFTGRDRFLQPRYLAGIYLVPTIALFLAATNQLHHLLWTGDFIEVGGINGRTISVYERDFEPIFYVYLGYIQLVFLGGVYLLMRMALTSADVYRRQTIAFVVGSAVPVAMGILFTLDAVPFAPTFFDPTPLGYAFSGFCFAYAIFRHDMLDLIPIARDTVIESMRDGYVVLDTENRIVDHNDSATELLPDDGRIIGEPVQAVLPEIRELLAEHEHGTRLEEEVEVSRDSERRFLLANLSTLTHNNRTIGRLLLLRDVTERRAVQRRYQALIENSSDLILVVDPDGTITYVSPSIQTMMGAPAETITGMNCFELIVREDREELRADFDRVVEEPGAKIRTEYRTEDADGDRRVMEAVIRNMLDNPFIDGIVINARDITERKRREEELAKANQKLAETNRELEKTNVELEAANERLDQFASVISHDLRNPINVAKGHLDLAEQVGDPEHFQKVEGSLDRMETIIDDVLTLARQGDAISETQAVELEASAREAWGNVGTGAASLVVADDATFQSDPGRLLQLFENLFRNAVEHGSTSPASQGQQDAIEHGRDDVTVTVGFDEDTLYVEDDGPGIPEDERDDVLESGYTTNDSGTGLGLSIVSQIASAHGWSVSVTEGTDGGARFEFDGIERDVAAETD